MIYIQETYVDETQNCQQGADGWFETFTDNIGDLYRSLKKEYGNASNMYIDRINGGAPVKIGWVFTGRDHYEDTKEPYTRCVWVSVSTTKPEYAYTISNVRSPWEPTQ